MKDYIKKAVKELKDSDKTKTEITLKDKDDYKRNILRLLYNKLVLGLQKKIVPSHLKNFLLWTTGIKVGWDACIPHDIYMDAYFPELITLGRGCLVGGESFIHTHEVKGNKLILGKCIVKPRTLVGGLGVCKPGFVLNKHSMLMYASECDKEIPEAQLWGGKPAKMMKELSKEEVEKYFKPSNKNKTYYKKFKKEVTEFMKDPNRNFFKMHYDGKRENPGNDWWRARNVFRIFYNGAIIELCRLMPHNFIKTLLLKAAGIKIGKNVKIGKGVVFDHIYCDTITLEDNVKLDDYAYIDGHSYTITQTVFGKVVVKKGAHLKHHSFVSTGTIIGENAVLEPYSAAAKEVPANEVWAGMPAKFVKKK
ncbi:hypothetical protein KY331_04235 [Candidatus Woesearchaeota archaeon]|nr:hypothetical protein [Candidatus Woesearchaeota archaeon]